jgi:CRP/FNR family cyclic AMP-dependent transcriptional regulator
MKSAAADASVLTDALLREIAARGSTRKFAANTVIITENDVADSLYIILSGRVKVYAGNEAGKEVIINTLGPGEYLGEVTLDGGVRSASVMTLEPTTCSVVSGANLREFVAAHPDFASHLILKLIRSVRDATESVKSLALEDVYARVIRLLNDISDPAEGGQRRVRERLTQQDIADRIGASREMVSRIVKDLTAGGYLDLSGGRIVIARKPPASW